MRLDWARRMKELLAPSGVLVCLEFPMYKDVNAAGPPYGLKGVYWDLLAEGKDGRVAKGKAQSEGSAASGREERLERVLYYQPSRTYKAGEGTDMVSAWRHKQG